MNIITGKLRSDRGASITFALLAFLVCAVLSTIIIIAATVAAGRISQLTETDQRYYTTTSAAEMLEEILGTETITIVEEVKKTRTTRYDSETGEVDGPIQTEVVGKNIYLVPGVFIDPGSPDPMTGKYDYEGYPNIWDEPTITMPDSFASYGDNENAKLAAYIAGEYALSKATDAEKEFNLKLDADGNESLDAELTGTMNSSGVLNLQIAAGADEKMFKLDMILEADIRPSHDDKVVGEIEPKDNRDENRVVEDLRSYDKTTVTWQLTDIETVK